MLLAGMNARASASRPSAASRAMQHQGSLVPGGRGSLDSDAEDLDRDDDSGELERFDDGDEDDDGTTMQHSQRDPGLGPGPMEGEARGFSLEGDSGDDGIYEDDDF